MSAQAKIKKFAKKGYRDAYVSSRVRSSVALQVRDNRKKQKLTQNQLAKLMGKSQSDVSHLENPDGDHVTVQSLLDAAAALNVALVIRFASYPDFLNLMSDMSPDALSVETINETIAGMSRPQSVFGFRYQTSGAIFIGVPTAGDLAWINPKPSLTTRPQLSESVQTNTERSMQIYAKVGSAPSILH